jgi:Xaa-Pro dipeptidase
VGPNSAEDGSEIGRPWWESRGNKKLRQGDCVLIDLAGTVPQGYTSDLARGVGFGPVPKQYRDIVPIVIESMEKSVSAAKSGSRVGDIDKASHGVVNEAGYGKYYTHEAFHGLGLEVEEAPFLHDSIMKENMVISVESGIYIPNKMGIRLEDVVVVTDAGPKVLTHSPREIFVF